MDWDRRKEKKAGRGEKRLGMKNDWIKPNNEKKTRPKPHVIQTVGNMIYRREINK